LKRDKNRAYKKVYCYAAYVAILASLLSSPAVSDVYSLLFSRPDKTIPNSSGCDFNEFYKQPYIKQVGDTKNLVLIYAEGLERTYFDRTIFPGLIKGLRELEARSTYFTNVKQVPCTEWTIAGMVASQCGIPLFTPSHGNSMSGMDQFLPSAFGLGDLLHKQGYHLTYYGGADLRFAGKGKFYSTHNFDEIYGKDELLSRLEDESYKTSWGLYDDSLFDLAYDHFLQLSEAHEKFALVLLTLDTHHPRGHPSKRCQSIAYQDVSNPMLNAVACSDYLITEFIGRIMRSEYGHKTVIVVVSDHLAMTNTASDLLNRGERRNLFMIVEPDAKKGIRIEKTGSMLDVGATILPFIGYKGALGLGRNLGDEDQSESELKYIHKNLHSWQPSISRFWSFPKIRDYVIINTIDKTMSIDGRKFGIPALIELTPELDTTLKFQFYRAKEHKKLIDHVLALDDNTSFLLVDKFDIPGVLEQGLGKTGFYLVTGKGDQCYKRIRIEKEIKLTAEDVRRFTGLSTPYQFCVRRIAHAGGEVEGNIYTNSLDALNKNIRKGFSYFELDFCFTKDRELVCIHDWQDRFKGAFGFEAEDRPSLETFEVFVQNASGYKNCTLDTLITWMEQNPSAFIITDVKEDNLKALKIISEKVPDFRKRIIPQIFEPSNYERVKRIGYEQIIWTLYRYGGNNGDVLEWANKFRGAFAITMPKNRAKTELPRKLARKHIPTYVHTVNTSQERKEFMNQFGVTEIYTDYLCPEND